jgi:predicted metal-dependent HD superfamily phosphohydrolase/GNAT superfamily N-acetyltransferase
MPVRQATARDLVGLYALERAVYPAEPWPMTGLRQAIDLGQGAVLVAEEEGELVGAAYGAWAGPEAWLLSLLVHPQRRGAGWGLALAQAALNALEAGGPRRLRLTVAPENEGARRLYAGLGFRETGLEEDYYGPGAHRLLAERGGWLATVFDRSWGGDRRDGGFEALMAAYQASGRHYHTGAHLLAVLRWREALFPGPDPEADLALLYHDALYQPLASDNEERSADWFDREAAARGWSPARRLPVVEAIRATAHRPDRQEEGSSLAARVLDCDLAVLGAEPASYTAYVDAVRREYAQVPEPLWRAGRGRLLEGLLSRPALFSTAPGRARFEAKARANLERELASLKDKHP